MITRLDEIVSAAVARGKKRLAVAYGQDTHTMRLYTTLGRRVLLRLLFMVTRLQLRRLAPSLALIALFSTSFTSQATLPALSWPYRL